MKASSFKVVLIGESNAGKSSFLHRLMYESKLANELNSLQENSIPPEYELPPPVYTVGTAFAGIKLNNQYRIHIWDTAGQERYKSLVKMYTRDSDAVILMFDITDKWEETKEFWISFIKKNFDYHSNDVVCGCAPIILLLANKIDLKDDFLESSKSSFIQSNTIDPLIQSIKYFPISVKTGYNINEVYQYLAQKLVERSQTVCSAKNNTIREELIDVSKKSRKKCKLFSCF